MERSGEIHFLLLPESGVLLQGKPALSDLTLLRLFCSCYWSYFNVERLQSRLAALWLPLGLWLSGCHLDCGTPAGPCQQQGTRDRAARAVSPPHTALPSDRGWDTPMMRPKGTCWKPNLAWIDQGIILDERAIYWVIQMRLEGSKQCNMLVFFQHLGDMLSLVKTKPIRGESYLVKSPQ